MLTVISENVEGLSDPKEQLLANICKTNICDVLCLQEIHRGFDYNRPKINGMMLVIERPHEKYGSAIFVKTGTIIDNNNMAILTAETGGTLITSVYKPPSRPYQMPPLHNSKPEVVIGDFNSHSVNWAYDDSNADGDAVECWPEASQLSLVLNAKQPSSFNSRLGR